MQDFSKIRNLEQLEMAEFQVKEQMRHKEAEFMANYRHAKTFYTPASLFNHVVDSFTPVANLTGIAVAVYDRVRAAAEDARDAFRERRERDRREREYFAEPIYKDTPEANARRRAEYEAALRNQQNKAFQTEE